MSDKEYMECSVVAYPREIRVLHINGSAISYYVDRHISDYVDRLQKENQELKKQLEEKENKYIPGEYAKNEYIKTFDENILLKNQQKEFIEYLENEIELCELTSDLIFNHNKEMKIYKEILSKYKEIIGGKE